MEQPGSRRTAPTVLLLLAAAVFAAGCLPSSCNRTESRALNPADSLSRRVAAGVVPDTLIRTGSFVETDEVPIEYIRSLVYGRDGRLYAADPSRDEILIVGPDGRYESSVRSDLFSYPFVTGVAGDSLVVFSPGRRHIQLVDDGIVVEDLPTPADTPRRGLLQWALRLGGRVYVKLLGDEFTGRIIRLETHGPGTTVAELRGPPWRHAGFLRAWGDTLVSLSGYRPAVDLVLPDGTVDSLRLTGFDSPMLARLRLFETGEVDAPALLTASAAALGDHLYVLNMRPGWLRIDVYDRRGFLSRVLTEPDPAFNQDYYPTDLAVRQVAGSGRLRFAVAVLQPEPRIDFFEWVDG